jgi:hypothetical protein
MKKLLALVMVLALCAGGVFAQAAAPSVHGDFTGIVSAEGDNLGTGANLGKVRVYVAAPVSEFVTFKMDLRDDATSTPAGESLGFNQIYVVTNVSGALGMKDISLTLTGGYWENWMGHFNSATETNRARHMEIFAIGHQPVAAALDIGYASFGKLLTYFGFDGGFTAYKFGFELGPVVEGLNAIASYSGMNDDSAQYFKVEAGYTFAVGDGMTLYIPANFLDNIKTYTVQWGSGLKFTGFGLLAAVGVGSADVTAAPIDVLDAQLAYSFTDKFAVFANAFTNPGQTGTDDDFFQALDVGVRANLGGNKVYIGYVLDAGKDTAIAVAGDDSAARTGVTGGGIYLAWSTSF